MSQPTAATAIVAPLFVSHRPSSNGEYRVRVFKTTQSAAGKARYLPCVTTIEEYRR